MKFLPRFLIFVFMLLLLCAPVYTAFAEDSANVDSAPLDPDVKTAGVVASMVFLDESGDKHGMLFFDVAVSDVDRSSIVVHMPEEYLLAYDLYCYTKGIPATHPYDLHFGGLSLDDIKRNSLYRVAANVRCTIIGDGLFVGESKDLQYADAFYITYKSPSE